MTSNLVCTEHDAPSKRGMPSNAIESILFDDLGRIQGQTKRGRRPTARNEQETRCGHDADVVRAPRPVTPR